MISSVVRTIADTPTDKDSPRSGAPWGLRWTEEDGELFVLSDDALPPRARIAAFDLDHTLVVPASGKTFSQDRADWRWVDPAIPTVLRRFHAAGYRIVIFTNQKKLRKRPGGPDSVTLKILDMVTGTADHAGLGIPIVALAAGAANHYRKPHRRMWDVMARRLNGGAEIVLADSFYCGDAAGRAKGWDGQGCKADFSASDRMFAHNIGVPFCTPEELFAGQAPVPMSWGQVPPWELVAAAVVRARDEGLDPQTGLPPEASLAVLGGPQRLVIGTGSPASGKTTWIRTHLEQARGYTWINQDTLRTKKKCLRATRDALEAGQHVVVDNTNPQAQTRAEYAAIARALGVPVSCVWFDTPDDICRHLSTHREKISGGETARLSSVVFNVFRGRFAPPDAAAEGFEHVLRVGWVPRFRDAAQRSAFEAFSYG